VSQPTLEDLDEDIRLTREAIRNVLKTSQSVNRPGLGYTRAAMSDLREHLKYLLCMRDKMTGGMIVLSDQSGNTSSGVVYTGFLDQRG